MILWIDAQLSPALARWLSDTFGVAAHAVRNLGLRDAKACLSLTPHGRLLG
jgi:predicted nuclease of predicted toxin-antitoxin system